MWHGCYRFAPLPRCTTRDRLPTAWTAHLVGAESLGRLCQHPDVTPVREALPLDEVLEGRLLIHCSDAVGLIVVLAGILAGATSLVIVPSEAVRRPQLRRRPSPVTDIKRFPVLRSSDVIVNPLQ